MSYILRFRGHSKQNLLHQGKCKELRIGFTKSGTYFDPSKSTIASWRWYPVLRFWV